MWGLPPSLCGFESKTRISQLQAQNSRGPLNFVPINILSFRGISVGVLQLYVYIYSNIYKYIPIYIQQVISVKRLLSRALSLSLSFSLRRWKYAARVPRALCSSCPVEKNANAPLGRASFAQSATDTFATFLLHVFT